MSFPVTKAAAFLLAMSVTTALQDSGQAADPTSPTATSHSLIVTSGAQANEFLAYSSLRGKWSRFSASSDLKVTPVIDGISTTEDSSRGAVCALAYSGGTVSELAAVDRHGHWHKHKLPKPTRDPCSPFCNDGMAAYNIEGKVHVFSAQTGTWDTLSLPGLSKHIPTGADFNQFIFDATENGTIFLRTETHVAAFSVGVGRWVCAPLRVDGAPCGGGAKPRS